jgi:hypothetical protein
MEGTGVFKWWFADSEDAEYWAGPEATREGAISAGTNEYEGRPFWIFEADKSVCQPTFSAAFIAERIIEDIGENNECWSADGWDDAWTQVAIKDLERTIEVAVADWLKRNPAQTWAAGEIRVMEQIKP